MAKKRKAEFNSAVTRFYDNKSHGKYLRSKYFRGRGFLCTMWQL